MKTVEHRHPIELELHRAGAELGAGVAMGVVFVLLIALPLWLGGWYAVVGLGTASVWLIATASAATAAFMEELLMRALLFRLLEERAGTWLALAVTSTAFGALHLGNPNATWWSAVNIGLSAGLVLGLAFVLTRRLWLAIGIHFGFNFMEGAVLGLGVSGSQTGGLLEARVHGPDLVTGGEFGPESSLQTLVVGLALAAGLAWMARRRRKTLPLAQRVQNVDDGSSAE